ncbi:MAG: AMP-binding protein [Salinivirgaceae bacterium]|nr:AMP-binding protein [Salinivirgaceae bacterium]
MIDYSNLDKIALITNKKQFTYLELAININKYTKFFENKSYEKVAIFSENRPEWIFVFYAALMHDCIVVPIDFMSSISEVSFIINDCKPEFIFTSKNKTADLEKAIDLISHKPERGIFDTLELNEKNDTTLWKGPSDKEKTAVIIYTSGTTGSPKGVMLSYINLLANIKCVIIDSEIYTPERQVLIFLPLHHIFPLVGTMMAPLSINATMVMVPSMLNSDLMETLKNNQVAIMIGVPRLYEIMYKGIKAKIDTSIVGRILFKIVSTLKARSLAKKIFGKVHEGLGGHMQTMVAGGAALPKVVGDFFYSLGFDILEGFGMTEASPMITFTSPGRIKPGSPGQKVVDLQVEIRDGEIVAKGSHIMKGYYNRPKETAAVIKDGWLYTGDLGYFDKQGFLFVTGRKKEIIVLSNGKNINPVEVEDKLERMSKYISEAAVIMYKNQLHATIVPDYNELAADDIKNLEVYFRNEVLTNYNEQASSSKKIMQFTLFKTDIPRTRLGKIQRFKLAEMIDKPQGEKKKNKDPEFEEYKTIKTFIENETSSNIDPDDHLEFDIALDSLGKLSLIDFLDKTFGVKIEENQLLKFPSIRKLVEFVKDNKLRYKVENIDWSAILKEKTNLKLPKVWFTQRVFKHSSKWFFKLYFRFNGQGMENIPEGACIIAPNHQSYFDGMFVASLIRNNIMRQTYFYAKKKHIKTKLANFLARKNNVIVMDLNNDLKESIQKLAEVLKMGRKIIIFPEGTRTKDGKLGEFKKTFAILSKELNVPVVPVVIDGAYDALPSGKKFPKIFSKINVKFLPPIEPKTYTYDSLSEIVKTKINDKMLS